jgi:hypothetical protein
MADAPDEDMEFRYAIKEVFLKYPEAQRKYALSSLALEEQMGIDLDRQVGVSRVDGNKIITEFENRDSPRRRTGICVKWNFDYSECLHWIEAQE